MRSPSPASSICPRKAASKSAGADDDEGAVHVSHGVDQHMEAFIGNEPAGRDDQARLTRPQFGDPLLIAGVQPLPVIDIDPIGNNDTFIGERLQERRLLDHRRGRYDDPVGPKQRPADEGADDRQQAALCDDFRMPVDDQRRPLGKPQADRQIDQRKGRVKSTTSTRFATVCQTRKGNDGETGIDQTLLSEPARCTSIPSTISEAPEPRTRETSTSLRHQRAKPAARRRMISGMPPLTSG